MIRSLRFWRALCWLPPEIYFWLRDHFGDQKGWRPRWYRRRPLVRWYRRLRRQRAIARG